MIIFHFSLFAVTWLLSTVSAQVLLDGPCSRFMATDVIPFFRKPVSKTLEIVKILAYLLLPLFLFSLNYKPSKIFWASFQRGNCYHMKLLPLS